MRNWQAIVHGKNQYYLTEILLQIRNKAFCDQYDFRQISALCAGIGNNFEPYQWKYGDSIKICGTYLDSDDFFIGMEKWKKSFDGNHSLTKNRVSFEKYLASKRDLRRLKIKAIREFRLLKYLLKLKFQKK